MEYFMPDNIRRKIQLFNKLLCQTFLLVTTLLLLAACDVNEPSPPFKVDSGHLVSLKVSGLSMSPAFELSQRHYVSTAENNVTNIHIKALAIHSSDQLLINGELIVKEQRHNLAIGNNLFTIVVRTKAGHEETYRLTVTRLAEVEIFNSAN